MKSNKSRKMGDDIPKDWCTCFFFQLKCLNCMLSSVEIDSSCTVYF